MDRKAAKELLHIKGDLPAWNESLQELYEAAAKSIEEESG
jgi:hypothetical protein